MRIDTTFDEVLYAATMGLEPDAEDFARVTIPAGEDRAKFISAAKTAASKIVAAHRQGMNDEAREIAATAKTEYETKFAALMPAPAGGQVESVEDIAARMFRR